MDGDQNPYDAGGSYEFDEGRNYPALDTIQTIIKVLTWLGGGVGVIVALFTMYTGMSSQFGGFMSFVTGIGQLVMTFIICIFYYAFAEMIGLAVDVAHDLSDIQSRTRRIHSDME